MPTAKPSKGERAAAAKEAKAVKAATVARAPRPEQAPASGKVGGKAAKQAPNQPAAKKKGVSREQALAAIREALEAKKQRARQGPSWPGANPHLHRANDAAGPPGAAEGEPEASDQTDPAQRAQRDKHQPRGVR